MERERATSDLHLPLTVALGLLPSDELRYSLHILGQVGVRAVVPVMMGLDREFRRRALKLIEAEGEELLTQGAKISGASPPQLFPAQGLDRFLDELKEREESKRLFLWEGEARGERRWVSRSIWRVGVELSRKPSEMILLVGPKPGILPLEVEGLLVAGFQPVSLGHRLYTAPTALALALGVVVAAWGELAQGEDG